MRRPVFAVALVASLLLTAGAAPPRAAAGGAMGSPPAPVTPTDVASAVFRTGYSPVGGTAGGTLAVGDWQYPDSLNPYFAFTTSAYTAISTILRGCATVASDGKYVPDLCASVPSDTNGDVVVSGSTFTVTVHLRPNLAWSDGAPLTMDDLRFTWQWASDPAQQAACGTCYVWADVSAIDVSPDKLSATLHFSHLTSGWLSLLTNAILPQHYMSGIADPANDSYPVGDAVKSAPVSGPFKVTAVTSDEIDFVRNASFHAGVAPSHQGGAYLDGLAFHYFSDTGTEIDALRAGDIDLALGLGPGDYPTLKGVPASTAASLVAPARTYELLDLNNDPSHGRKNGLWDVTVRKAIATAVNRKAIGAVAYPGMALTVPCVPVGVGTWYAKTEACPAYSASAAQALLAKAGWKVDSQGWVAKGGREMSLTICTTTRASRIAEAKAVAAALRKVHVRTTVQPVPSTDLYGGWSQVSARTRCNLAHGTFDIAIFSYSVPLDPGGNFSIYDSAQWPEKGQHYGQNMSRFASRAMDAALHGLRSDVMLAAQLADAGRAQDAYTAGIPEIALYYVPSVVGLGVRVGNFAGIGGDGMSGAWNVEDWFVRS